MQQYQTRPFHSPSSLKRQVVGFDGVISRYIQCGTWMGKITMINKIMNDQEDQFFVEPQVQQVRDIRFIEQPNPIIEKPITQEPKHIPLKMLQIPKNQEYSLYKPFQFQNHQSEKEDEDQEMRYDYESPFTQFYSEEQCVYRRYWNDQFNRINEKKYFSGAFLHRNIFLDGNFSEISQLSQAAKLYYEVSTQPLPQPKEKDLIFDSKFESGNLFAVFKVKQTQYDLVMSNDTNSTGSNQWFFFSVSEMIPDKQYTFSVVNFTKSDSLFNYGMLPAVYSMAQNKNVFGNDRGWRRQGKEVSYKKSQIPRQNSKRMYYKLTFKLSTMFENDKLFVAHSYPYTTQKLYKFIADRTAKFKDVVTKVIAGKTLSKRPIEALMITQGMNKKRDSRKAILIMARQHPGQCQGSYVCQGVIDKLLSKTKQGEFLLKNYVVYVIPMVNPDGVVFGHYRTNLAGKDLNRKWNATDKDLNCPEVSSIKNFIQQISKERDIRFIIDLHGHSKKLNSFFYGNPCPQNPDAVRIFPYACSKLHSGVQFMDCTFTSQQYKRKAARIYLSFLYRLIHVYTFQSSFYAYFKDGRKIEFTPKEYRELGGTLVIALFMQLEHQIRFQQSFEFNLKKNNTKDYIASPFVKMLAQLKSNKQLMQLGSKNDSGSESNPEVGQVNNQEMQSLKPVTRPLSTKTEDVNNPNKTNKTSRKGIRQVREFNFNKPIRHIKFLQISRVNSILPDKYQLGLQPIKKKEVATTEVAPRPQTARAVECQTDPRSELKHVQFKSSQIQTCVLANSQKIELTHDQNFSSVIRSNNRNIIFKFDIFGQTTTKQDAIKGQKPPLVNKNAYSQTMITYSKEQGEKIKTSQVLPQVETPERDEKQWARNNSIRVESSLRTGFRREAQIFFNSMVKRLMVEKEAGRTSEPLSNKLLMQKPLSIKKKEILRK